MASLLRSLLERLPVVRGLRLSLEQSESDRDQARKAVTDLLRENMHLQSALDAAEEYLREAEEEAEDLRADLRALRSYREAVTA